MADHIWEYDRVDREWRCTVCAAPYTGRGPSRPPPPGDCEGMDAYVKHEHPWGRSGYDGGGLDELVAVSTPDRPIGHVHVERMDTGAWWMRIHFTDGSGVAVNWWVPRGQPRTVSAMFEGDR